MTPCYGSSSSKRLCSDESRLDDANVSDHKVGNECDDLSTSIDSKEQASEHLEDLETMSNFDDDHHHCTSLVTMGDIQTDDLGTGPASNSSSISSSSQPLQDFESDNSSVIDPSDFEDMDSDDYQPDSQLSQTGYVASDFTLIDMEQRYFLNQPLYAGSTVSVIHSVASHLMWFTSHPNISKDFFSDMFLMGHSSALPPDNLLPCSYTDLIKLVEPFLIKPIIFHCCPNDCLVFRGNYANAKVCPHCSSSRYKPN